MAVCLADRVISTLHHVMCLHLGVITEYVSSYGGLLGR